MTTVTAVGLAVLDFVFAVETGPDRGRKVFASSLVETGGGPAATAAVTVAALGGTARFIGSIGDDTVGDRIIDDFTRWRVDAGGVRRVPGVPSPLSSVVVESDGERTIVHYADPRLHLPDDVVTMDEVRGADVVLADLRWPIGGMSALAAAAELGVPSVLDFDETPESGLPGALETPTHIVFAAPALAAVAGTEDPAEGLRNIARRTAAWVGVTLGAKGALWLDGTRLIHTPAFPVTTVDTLGAGDVFHGAFALALGEGRPMHEIVQRAAAAAALKCTRFGGREGIPSLVEVEAFMEENPG